MRVRRADEHAIGLVLLRCVVDESAEPLDQRGVLDARLERMVMVVGALVHGSLCQFALPVILCDQVTSNRHRVGWERLSECRKAHSAALPISAVRCRGSKTCAWSRAWAATPTICTCPTRRTPYSCAPRTPTP